MKWLSWILARFVLNRQPTADRDGRRIFDHIHVYMYNRCIQHPLCSASMDDAPGMR